MPLDAINTGRVRSRRTLAVLTALAVAAVSVGLWFPEHAFAHAIVRETEPGIDEVVDPAPERVVMRFNEPVELSFGAIRVFDTEGRRVDAGAAGHLAGEPDAIQVPLEEGLEKGTYTVTWRVVSADGHPISEAFVFHVEEPGENPRGIADEILAGEGGVGGLPVALFGVARWLNFAGLIVLGGAAAFVAWAWRGREHPSPQVGTRFARRFALLVSASWTAVVVATLAGFALQGSVAGGLPLFDALSPSVVAEVAGTRYGRIALLKLVLLAALAALWLGAARPRMRAAGASVGAARAHEPLSPWLVAVTGALLVALLATPGLSGHAGTTEPVAVNLAADTLHLAAAAAWLGGLAALVVAGFGAVKGLSQAEAAAAMAPVVTRFSDAAVIAVAVIVVTGTYRAWLEVGALRALTGAAYGWVLLAKLAVFLPLLVLGAVNNRWTKPRLERAVAAGNPEAAPLGTLARVVRTEIVLGAVVLAATALLVNLPPARIEAGVVGPFVADVRLGTYNLNILVDPNQVGENEVHLTATSPEGAPAPIEEMRVLFRMPREEIGPLVGQATELAPGHFVVQGRQLSVSGEWRLEIVARIGRFEEERASVIVTVN